MTNTIKLVYGSLWPLGHFGRTIAEQFAKTVTQKTNGEIMATVTPPSPDSQLTKEVLDGTIQMTSGHDIQEYVPQVALTYHISIKALNSLERYGHWGSPVSDTLVKIVEGAVDVKILGYSLIGYRDVILRKGRSIVTPNDFVGLRIRNDGSSTTHDAFEAFGADPTAIEYHKVKEALKNGVVDAAANTSFNLIYMGWYQECTNVSLTEHQMLLNCELINDDFWNGLTNQHQTIIQNAMNIAVQNFCDTAAVQRGVAITELQNKFKLQVNDVSQLTKKELADKVLPMKTQFVKQYHLEKEYEYILSH